MAVITIADTDFQAGADATFVGTFSTGEAISAGMLVYQDSSGLLWKADCNAASDTTGLKAKVIGFAAATAAAAGQKIPVVGTGTITTGNVLTAGIYYLLSGTAGKMCLPSDLVTDDWVCWCARAISATQAKVNIYWDGYKKA